MEPWLATVVLFSLLVIIIVSGLPIAFALSGIGLIFMYVLMGPQSLAMLPQQLLGEGSKFVLIAIPLFVLMANFLEVSGIADNLYSMMYHWLGNIPGGLASGTILICAIFAAMAGISGVATVTMGLIAIPSMLQRGYDKRMVAGTVAAGGALGILIPPSIIAVLYGSITGTSVGGLFMGGMIPGIILACIFIIYITVRVFIQKDLAPRVNIKFSWVEKLASLKGVVFPVILIFLVLGTIYTGICTPTESAGFGAFGAVIACAIYRKLTWQNIKMATFRTLNVTVMCVWIVFGAAAFSGIYHIAGASKFMLGLVGGLTMPPMTIIAMMMFVWMVLGCLLDPVGMCMITVPVFLPIVEALGYDPLWFGVLFIVNCEMAYLTPPFGFNLFYLKAIVPPEITMGDIYRSITPFVFCQLACLILVMCFPELALWLPKMMITKG